MLDFEVGTWSTCRLRNFCHAYKGVNHRLVQDMKISGSHGGQLRHREGHWWRAIEKDQVRFLQSFSEEWLTLDIGTSITVIFIYYLKIYTYAKDYYRRHHIKFSISEHFWSTKMTLACHSTRHLINYTWWIPKSFTLCIYCFFFFELGSK